MRRILLPALLLVVGCPTEPDDAVLPPPPAEGPVAPMTEPEAVTTDWWIGLLDSTSNDVVLPDILDGGLDRPEAGEDAAGTYWFEVDSEDGNLGSYNAQYWYAVSERAFDPDDRVFLRTNGTSASWIGDKRQTGYFYNDGRNRIPMLAPAEESRVVLRGLGGRGTVGLLWRTTDELVINTADTTQLHLLVGDDTERWLGAPVLNLTQTPALDLIARVVENEYFEGTTETYAALGPASTSQIGWRLVPKAAPTEADATWTALLQVGSRTMEFSYQATVEIGTKDPTSNHWRTFRSPVDGSIQNFGVLPPTDPSPSPALFLSLHGAGVLAAGQSGSYSAKEDAYIVAPTNRHHFGFDWEEWGRFNALATLDHAMDLYAIDPTRVYLTGHSMGGHGTWHVGTSTPGRFATLAPSAGWESFYSYPSTTPRPGGALARSRAHSDTLDYMENLARRGVYIIHGDADDNVPVSEGRKMRDEAMLVTEDVEYHEQPGAGHWWDADGDEPGADCVDWEPMIAWALEHTLDPAELEFSFRTEGPGYSPDHSYVHVSSAATAWEDVVLSSSVDGATVTLDTVNARSLVLDGDKLTDKGITSVVVNGEAVDVVAGPIAVGPQDGKTAATSGPFNQAFRQPFCFVYPDDSTAWRDYAAYLTSYWKTLGNGRACGLRVSDLTDAIRADHQLIWLGVPMDQVPLTVPIAWDDRDVEIGDEGWREAVMWAVFPRGDKLDAVIVAGEGHEGLAYDVMPFSSRSGLPDYGVLDGSYRELGFWGPTWEIDPQ